MELDSPESGAPSRKCDQSAVYLILAFSRVIPGSGAWAGSLLPPCLPLPASLQWTLTALPRPCSRLMSRPTLPSAQVKLTSSLPGREWG